MSKDIENKAFYISSTIYWVILGTLLTVPLQMDLVSENMVYILICVGLNFYLMSMVFAGRTKRYTMMVFTFLSPFAGYWLMAMIAMSKA